MRLLRLVAFAAALACSLGCPQSAVCVAGKTETCACPDGTMGAQTCDATGSGFGACECSSAPSCTGAGAPTCGSHGVCTATATAASCACFPGYAGASCAACATGYQDNDGNGECTPSCASLTCTNGGVCNDADGSAECVCPAAFTGSSCSECAAGFQDRDGNGTCEAACTATACGTHGTCTDVTGQSACVCLPGYTGMTCAACATGFQDANQDGTCEPTCATAMRDCGAGGTCSETSGTPTCQCAVGYTGPSCAQCAAGFQDFDQNNSCEPACGATACSGHGACDDQSGRVVCACTAGYTGADCAQCASGFQDGDGNGTCLPACTPTTCGTRERCVDTSGTATCQCVTGFTPGDAGVPGLDCRFTGGLLDPSFQATPAGAWTIDGGWVANPTGTGVSDVGVMTLPAASRGRTDATLSQTFTLAGSELREGLQMTIRGRETACLNFGCFGERLPLQFSLNGAVMTLPVMYSAAARTYCLGSAALGPSTTLVVSGGPGYGVAGVNSLELDSITFQPSTSCPAPGELRNGDFQAGPWASVGSGGTATVVVGGATATAGGRLASTNVCQGPAMATPFSIPDAATLPNAALHFTLASPTSSRFTVKLDNTVLASSAGSPTPAGYTVCLPEALRGTAGQLTVALDFTGGSCAIPDVRQVDFDDVALVSDTSCTAGAAVFNGGFERVPRDGFAISQDCPNGPCPAGTISARHVISATEAHSGTGFYQLSLGQRCAGNRVTMGITVPKSTSAGGPALRYFYRLPTLDANARMTVGVEGLAFAQPPASSTWAPRIQCLEPRMAGRYATVQFSLDSSGTCAQTYANDVLSIDDVDVYLDATCPR